MPSPRRSSHTTREPRRWFPLRPVPWPGTGDPHLDLLRAAVEARLYPYGDMADSPGRSTSSHQLSLLAHGVREGMTDAEVSSFLSANLMCGGTPVYRRSAGRLDPAGYVVFSGRYGPADVMGRRPFHWHLSATPAAGSPPVTWEAAELYDAFRRAFGVPLRTNGRTGPIPAAWDDEQGVLF
ncbi:MAG TPA: hypothetical protein VLK84_11820 [Longimicrobium sp.]|nr:hypothetical protein [Longimicrobium sp.]